MMAQMRDVVLPTGTLLLTRPVDKTELYCPYRTVDELVLHARMLHNVRQGGYL